MDIDNIKKIQKSVTKNGKKGCYKFDYINKKIYIKKVSYDIVDFNKLVYSDDPILKYAILTINQ